MKLKVIMDILDAEIITGHGYLDREVSAVCASDLMSDVLAYGQANSILLTGLATVQVIYTVEMTGNRVICFVRDKRPPKEAVCLAEEKEFVLLCTKLSMFESCGRLFERELRGVSIPLRSRIKHPRKRSANHK